MMKAPAAPTLARPPRSIHQKGAEFPVRRMDFDFKDIDPHFVRNDPACSHVWTAFQSMFPEGEQFFVDAVRAAKPRIQDKKLLENISAFIGQEAMHGKEHLSANEELKRHGINVDGWDATIGWLRKSLNKRLGVRSRLAGTAAVEHYTATMAEAILRSERFTNSISDSTIKQLIIWHAIEEVEHRSVAFDAHRAIGGTYRERAIAMTIVSLGIVPLVGAAMLHCMKQDKQLTNFKSWRRFGKMYFGRKGLFSSAIPALLDFYRKDFHPNDADPDRFANWWKDRLQLNVS